MVYGVAVRTAFACTQHTAGALPRLLSPAGLHHQSASIPSALPLANRQSSRTMHTCWPVKAALRRPPDKVAPHRIALTTASLVARGCMSYMGAVGCAQSVGVSTTVSLQVCSGGAKLGHIQLGQIQLGLLAALAWCLGACGYKGHATPLQPLSVVSGGFGGRACGVRG